MNPVVAVQELSKDYNNVHALRNVSMNLYSKKVYGLIGPNGAGKTTFLKLLCGIIKPTNGLISIFNIPHTNPTIRRKIGYISENVGFYDYMNSYTYLSYFARNYPNSNDSSNRISELINLVGLEYHKNKKISAYSKGMKQRLGLARLLYHDPELLICDEPLSGVDSIGKAIIVKLLRELGNFGKTIIISSHELKEIEHICDEVILIKSGEIIAHGSTSEIQNDYSGNLLTLSFFLNSIDSQLEDIIRSIPEVHEIMIFGSQLKLRVKNTIGIEKKVLNVMLENEIDISLQSGRLDEIYVSMVGENDKP